MTERHTLIIDGHNVMNHSPVMRHQLARDHEQGRRMLLAFCAEWLSRRRDVAGFCVVFDGDPSVRPPAAAPSRGIRVLYAHGAGRADDRIVKLLDEDDAPAHCVVVTADRELAARARARGAQVWPPGKLFDVLHPGAHVAEAAHEEADKNGLPAAARKQINDEMRKYLGID
jgi:predicted RNA-binding protein with PIN domain